MAGVFLGRMGANQRRDTSLPRSVPKVPSSKWPAIASRESSRSIISEA